MSATEQDIAHSPERPQSRYDGLPRLTAWPSGDPTLPELYAPSSSTELDPAFLVSSSNTPTNPPVIGFARSRNEDVSDELPPLVRIRRRPTSHTETRLANRSNENEPPATVALSNLPDGQSGVEAGERADIPAAPRHHATNVRMHSSIGPPHSAIIINIPIQGSSSEERQNHGNHSLRVAENAQGPSHITSQPTSNSPPRVSSQALADERFVRIISEVQRRRSERLATVTAPNDGSTSRGRRVMARIAASAGSPQASTSQPSQHPPTTVPPSERRHAILRDHEAQRRLIEAYQQQYATLERILADFRRPNPLYERERVPLRELDITSYLFPSRSATNLQDFLAGNSPDTQSTGVTPVSDRSLAPGGVGVPPVQDGEEPMPDFDARPQDAESVRSQNGGAAGVTRTSTRPNLEDALARLQGMAARARDPFQNREAFSRRGSPAPESQQLHHPVTSSGASSRVVTGRMPRARTRVDPNGDELLLSDEEDEPIRLNTVADFLNTMADSDEHPNVHLRPSSDLADRPDHQTPTRHSPTLLHSHSYLLSSRPFAPSPLPTKLSDMITVPRSSIYAAVPLTRQVSRGIDEPLGR